MMKKTIHWRTVLMTGVSAFALGCGVRADGLIVVRDPVAPVPGHFRFAPLEVRFHRVSAQIDGNVAVTHIDQEFFNPNAQRLEGTYLFPLPVGAHIDTFEMDVNGKMMAAEMLDADKARRLYEAIVRKAKDPALLEYVGQGAIKVRIFPIEPRAPKRVKIKYTEVLRTDNGITEYLYPLNTEKFSSVPLQDVSVKVEIKSKRPLKAVYCPSHKAEVKRHSETTAVVGFEEKNTRPDTDFRVVFSSRANDVVDLSMLACRSGKEDGYFMLMASPGLVEAKQLPKDVCFVIDTSGSMTDRKIRQAREALLFCLDNLGPADRFEVIRFSTEAEPFFRALTTANEENLDKARAFVRKFRPIGGTAIHEALEKALALRPAKTDDARPFQVVFLTDGLPTIGETSEKAITGLLDERNRNTRIFSFGVGTDVNTHLLDRIADETRGRNQYVMPEEDLELRLSGFYRKISQPVMTGVTVEMTTEQVRLSKVYPNRLPDLFNGETLLILGRYSGHGASAVRVQGNLLGQKKQIVADVTLPEEEERFDFIPKLWATRRVGWLLEEIRRNGESDELKTEIVTLAREHGIVTPYTAYLVMEDEAIRGVPLARRNFRELEATPAARDGSRDVFRSIAREAAPGATRWGKSAVANSQSVNQLRYNDSLQDSQIATGLEKQVAASAGKGYRVRNNFAQQARVVNGRAFYQNGNLWNDSTAQQNRNLQVRNVTFNSDAYFGLLREQPELAQWMSLGTDVDIVAGAELIQIRAN